MLLCDFYKISHRAMYPKGTQYVYSTWTPRHSITGEFTEVVNVGLEIFVQEWLIDFFNTHFFNRPLRDILREYEEVITRTIGGDIETTHIEDLHRLGYLPLQIHNLPEGSVVPIQTPVATIVNTDPRFFWLTNYIESLMSCELWQISTSATIARRYKQLFDKFARETSENLSFTSFQGHDFSMRGMSSLRSAILSGMGHLTSFVGTDTIPAIQAMDYYHYDSGLTGTSIPASEHSIQCAYENDEVYFKTLLTEVHPTGMVSIVSDGYDFWDVMDTLLPKLKEMIMTRDGKVVIRPDSGDPVDIICGTPNRKGAIQTLWEIFGGSINSKGYKELDPHIGLIYGDAITYDRATQILTKLREAGFSSTNVVFGIGSYTYQYNTRDTFGYACKSTACIINGREKHIFKDPKTDSGVKKSQKGLVSVKNRCWTDGHSFDETTIEDDFDLIFLDGRRFRTTPIYEIRDNCNK